MAFWQWSKTTASNGSADPTINYQEGQAPSSLNDSARAAMARTAEWRDDISGTITTGGTSTAYTIASNQVFDTLAHMNGAMLAFVPHTTNGATVTLSVDGLSARPLRSSPGVEIGAGVLVQGTPYVVTYNNADLAFYLQGFVGNPFNVPVAGWIGFCGSVPPNSNFAFPIGQAISRTTYATLFTQIGLLYGSGDGSTTFNVPDFRSRTFFGWDGMGAVTNRITVAGGNFDATQIGASQDRQNWTLTQAQLPAVAPTFTGNQVSLGTISTNQLLFIRGGGGLQVQAPGGATDQAGAAATVTIPNFTPSGTISNLGSGNSHPIVPPAIVTPVILRII